jgi:mono/diheme cytochrome c family protein
VSFVSVAQRPSWFRDGARENAVRSRAQVSFIVFAAAALAMQVAASAQAPGGAEGQGRGGGRGAAAAAPANVKAPTSPVTGNAVTGKKLYFDYACYSCHGFNGETGARAFVPNWPANLATEASFIAFLRGRANASPVQPSTSMPNYAAGTLTDPQAKDIYAYIRSFKANAPPADQIATFKQILANAQKPYKP